MKSLWSDYIEILALRPHDRSYKVADDLGLYVEGPTDRLDPLAFQISLLRY